MERNMIQHDLILFLGVRLPFRNFRIGLHALLQVLIQIIKARLGIGNFGKVGVNPVHTWKHTHCRYRKCGKCRKHCIDASGSRYIHGNIGKNSRDEYRFNQQSRCIIQYRIIAGNVCCLFTALIIIADKEILTV